LELKAEKENAHGADVYGNTRVLSVGYSPDGAKVVSSGYDGTIKVWDAGVGTDTPEPSAQN
jgi:WD40 repeat protein